LARIDKIEDTLPAVYKIIEPKIKLLNEHIGPGETDKFTARVHELVESYLQSNSHLLATLGTDFKSGKILLQTKEKDWGDFKRLIRALQEELKSLFDEFKRAHTDKLDLQTKPPRVVFGVTNWETTANSETDQNISTKDLVLHFLLAESIANTAERRTEPNPTGRGEPIREPAIKLSAQAHTDYFKKDFAKDIQAFYELYRRFKNSPDSEGMFEITDARVPFLSPNLIQAIRKGKVKERFPSLTDQDIAICKNLLEVVNTIDVLKPFVEEDIDQFCAHLEAIATLLKENPKTDQEKQNHLNLLWEQATISLKDRQKEGQSPIARTRLAVLQKVHKALSNETYNETDDEICVIVGDETGVGPILAKENYHTVLTFYAEKEPDIRRVLLGEGDVVTKHLRANEEAIVKHCRAISDASGGDELFMVAPWPLPNGDLPNQGCFRMAITRLPHQKNTNEGLAHILACTTIYAEKVLSALKGTTSTKPVNISISQ